jgi:hypothetical protein
VSGSQECACKDCAELALIPPGGGKSFCDDCTALGCSESHECLAKDIALHEDVHPDS